MYCWLQGYDPRIFFKGAIYNVFDTISPSFFYQDSLFKQKIVIYYRDVCRMSQGGPTMKMLVFWIYMPQSVMSRAVKLRAVAMGFGGMLPQEIFLK